MPFLAEYLGEENAIFLVSCEVAYEESKPFLQPCSGTVLIHENVHEIIGPSIDEILDGRLSVLVGPISITQVPVSVAVAEAVGDAEADSEQAAVDSSGLSLSG